MGKYNLEEKIMKCKICKMKTVHIRSAKKWTIGRFLVTWLSVFLTCGLYLFALPFINKKSKWLCNLCMDRQTGKGA